MIRVSGLRAQMHAGDTDKSPDGLTPHEQLTAIREVVRSQLQQAASVLTADLLPQLASNSIQICGWDDLDPKAQDAARRYYRSVVFPVLTPLAVDPVHPFPFISNLSLSLAVEIKDPESGLTRFARIKVPQILPRLLRLDCLDGRADQGSGNETRDVRILPLEDLIRGNLHYLFPGMEIVDCHPFRVTRNTDLEILEDDAGDLLSAINRELHQRRFGAVVRLELTPHVPQRIRQLLIEKLAIAEEDVYEFQGLLGASALMSLSQLPRPELRDPAFSPPTPTQLSPPLDIFASIAAEDLLLHVPYESFTPVLDLVRQAAEDPGVLAIKMTLYRTGSNPDLISSLIATAESGKEVTVCVELKARFDEESNIAWAQALERAGVHVFYGAQGLKTHAKALLVVRREGNGINRYVHMSTGNYNATTARIYTDLGMFTADPEIGEDISELFNHLSGFSRQPKYRKLETGPHTLASVIIKKIEQQAEQARAGRPARIFAKMNSLVDVKAINALYCASQSGVEIRLCIRGICCLRPGVSGLSDNIHVFSVIGRFLEHSRVFIFGPEGNEEIYLSSADWMPRNFYNRVELMFPITSARLRERIYRDIVTPVMTDNCRVYELGPDGSYSRRTPLNGEPRRDAQQIVANYYREGDRI
jgi:polyphosphate kinase